MSSDDSSNIFNDNFFNEIPVKKVRKSRKCKYTKSLNRIKSICCYHKKLKQNDSKVKEFEKIRALLKIPDSRLEDFNRICELIGYEPFDRDKYVKEKYNIVPDDSSSENETKSDSAPTEIDSAPVNTDSAPQK